ncbi:hypothetical protein BGZ96_001746 [Linnemannia gamsii]|uniref:Uncharacterized protein n=1 Tax=Linnemannia gamsii TaxID=64522 RepID=A0ABQ7K8S3_9FUNG|nr:hypothetical protein BGZ96_001746 [Linnemannia gamsii]
MLGGRPTSLQYRAIEYIVTLNQQPSSASQDFMTYIRSHSQATSAPTIAALWKTIREWFEDERRTSLAELHHLMDVPALVRNLRSMPLEITELTEVAEGTAPATLDFLPSFMSSSSSPPISTPSSQLRSSSSVGTTSSSLRSAAVIKMRDEFRKHFQAFKGTPWTLPSTAVMDNLLADYAETFRKESSLHSFVIDDINMPLNQVMDEADKEAIIKVLVTRSGESSPTLSLEESIYMGLFNKKPDELEEFLANGWGNTRPNSGGIDKEFTKRVWFTIVQIHFAYWARRYELPATQSESWYVHTLWGFLGPLLECHGVLVYQPGEICSAAPGLRKNKCRSLGARQLMGRKVDGLIRCVTVGLEICVMEAAKSDNGPNGTKALSDTRKLAKSMKDMYDTIHRESLVNIRDQLVTFGIRISAASITLYTLRQRPGRFYQLSLEDTVSFPPVRDMSGDNTSRILNVVSTVLRLKKQMMEMARSIQVWTTPHFDASDRQPVGDEWTDTLTTPVSSPAPSPSYL